MALLPTATGGGMPDMIEQIKACLEDFDDNGTSRRHMGGRMKRDRLAAIASKLNLEASHTPWIGHVLALLCESFEAGVINEIMTQGPGRYKKEWDKWELSEGCPQWDNRRGEDRIRNLVYDLLIEDLIILYKGYEANGGVQVKGLSVKGVCKKVKDEIGIVVIKDSYLRDQLERHGVTRNLRGQTGGRRGRNTQSVGSPSTLGTPTPTSHDIPSVSPRLNPTGRLLPNSLNTPSRIPTPTRHTYSSGGVSRRSSTTALTQGPSQSQLPKNTNCYPQSGMNSFSNITPFQQKSLQDSRTTPFTLSPAGGDLNHTPPYGDATFGGIDDGSHNFQLISNPLQFVPSSNGHFKNGNSQSFAPLQAGNWPMEQNLDRAGVGGLALTPINNMEEISYAIDPSASLSLPHTGTVVAQFNELLTQLPEKIELLTRRLDTEHTARVLLEARANEVDKWQKEYMRMGKKYEELTSHCESQEQYIKDLKQKTEHLENLNNTVKDFKVSEQTKREKLTDDLENLQQQYHVLDGTVQKLRNDNGELHSMVLSLRGMNEMHVEHINGLQTGLKKLEIENSDLKAHLNDLKNHNESLRTEMTKLQTENSQLVGRVGKLKDENRKLDKTVEALQQQKDSLQSDVAKLQAQNLEFNDEVAKLQKAKVNLDEKVDLLERESASFQQEKKALEINTTLECVSRFSIDSGVGESLRASVASSRKRQISITDEREEKRHRSVGFLSGDDSTFLADPDPDDLDVMLPSELPIRRGSESSTQTKVEWI